MSDEVRARIEAALDEIRPAIQFDGGDVDLLDWDAQQGLVTISMVGACHGCSMSSLTLQAGIERILKERVPEVQALVNQPPEGPPTHPKY